MTLALLIERNQESDVDKEAQDLESAMMTSAVMFSSGEDKRKSWISDDDISSDVSNQLRATVQPAVDSADALCVDNQQSQDTSRKVRESRIQYLCDPQWFRDTASRGPTTIVAPESQFRTCPSDHDIIGYPRMSASGESSTMMHRLLHASGSHPIPPPNDPKTNQYNQDLGLIHSTNGNHLESSNEGSSIDHQVTIYLHAQNITMFPANDTWVFLLITLLATRAWLQPELQERRLFTVGGGRFVNQLAGTNSGERGGDAAAAAA
ncbi:wall-associated receptor kinase-like 1 [Dorcoceras hygrometricum]|uniref:Wall-associated receptor kinase-like 1 n=1 Tax=Dorcoceras hygrometricum TaxID=472368 RepID=A0A2Z7CAV8_9LAMI|nr:wall-associated receptor kinase-like 1 [Dorcoceras hygrometricum]